MPTVARLPTGCLAGDSMLNEELRERVPHFDKIFAILESGAPVNISFKWSYAQGTRRLVAFYCSQIDFSKVFWKPDGAVGIVIDPPTDGIGGDSWKDGLTSTERGLVLMLNRIQQDLILMPKGYVDGYDPAEHLKKIFERYDEPKADFVI